MEKALKETNSFLHDFPVMELSHSPIIKAGLQISSFSITNNQAYL